MLELKGVFSFQNESHMSDHFENVEGMSQISAYSKGRIMKMLPCVTFPETYNYQYETLDGEARSETTGYAFISVEMCHVLGLRDGRDVEVLIDIDETLEIGCQPYVRAARRAGQTDWYFDEPS